MEVYNNPKYYELAFSFRDIPKEVNFIEEVISKESKIPVKTFLEIASGNSPHMRELCKRGYEYIGLELNEMMVAYAENIIKKSALSAEIVKGDMVTFILQKSVDCALLFLGSFYVNSDEELRDHLDSVASVVRKGGLYILDGAVSFYPGDVRTQSWEMAEGKTKVTTAYEFKWKDEKKALSEAKITLLVDDEGQRMKLEHIEKRKIYSSEEFIKRASDTGEWEYAGSFGDFNIHKKPHESGRNIIVLRRR